MTNITPIKLTPRIDKVHWNCYGYCNMPCDFCYAWFDNKANLSTYDAIALLTNIRNELGKNVKFVFGGGDPLLRKDIISLMHFASQELGFSVELQTNAIKLSRPVLEQIIPSLDRIGFSLDGEDESSHTMMRKTPGNFYHIMDLISLLDEIVLNGGKIQTTIRSIVSQRNRDNLKGLFSQLIEHPSVTKWSLRQFAPLEEGAKTKVVHEIENADFNAVVNSIVNHSSDYLRLHPHPNTKIKIVKVGLDDMADCYCLIAPNGDAYYHPDQGTGYKSVGNILHDNAGNALKEIANRCTLRRVRDSKAAFFSPNEYA